MMRLPRDETGRSLARRLRSLGYEIVRQEGSHIRLETSKSGLHRITIPDHAPLKLGTLQSILREVQDHHELTREALHAILFR